MYAGRLLREAGVGLATVVGAALGWVLIAPFALAIPRRRDWVAVIGRDEGKFVDNAKYFFLQAAPLTRPGIRIVFVTERRDVVDLIADTDYEVMVYPSWRSMGFLLRSGIVIVDSIEWTALARRFLLLGAKRIQLWHGIGYKRIEIDKWRNETAASSVLSSPLVLALRMVMHRFTGRLIRYDLVNTTSAFYRDQVFARAFLAKHFSITGYPRNIFGELEDAIKSVAWRNVDASIARIIPAWLEKGHRIVLVTPTFRDSRASPMGLMPDVIAMLDEYCDRHSIELIFKFHSHERGVSEVRGRHLHLCSPESDIYPLMPVSSALITDYSSIYMDYLLINKPVLFLVPDLAEYIRMDRQLQFDFYQMTPGPKFMNWSELVAHLHEQWTNDIYAKARSRLMRMAFDDLPQEESVPRLIEFMRTQGWMQDNLSIASTCGSSSNRSVS